MDETVYYTCTFCCYGVSGRESATLYDKLDKHEEECSGKMKLERSDRY